MAFCKNCGAQMEDGVKFCPSCGKPAAEEAAPQGQHQQTFQQGVDRVAEFARNIADETDGIDPADIEKNKTMGGLAYFLFFLPLLACPESKYGRFHANQGLVYLFLCIGGSIINTLISAILTWRLWWLSSLISFVTWIPILVIGIIGLINGFSGKAKELPVIGKIRIIK